MNIGFVTDSTSDIPAELARQYGIQIIPALVNVNGKSYSDGIEISREEFYHHLPEYNPPPMTSSPSVGVFEQCYEKLFKAGMDLIVSIHPPNPLSGIYNAARLAAQDFGERVKVLDSGQLSLGLGFQVLSAAEAASRGAILEEVLAVVESIRKRVRLAALLNSLDYVRRSGRVSWALGLIGTVLRLQPLIELRYGLVHRLGQARTRLQGIERLMEALNSWGPLEQLAVLHTNAEAAALQLLETVRTKVNSTPLVVNVTTAIGTHVGPNGLGFVAVPVR
jgi:fatty acid kinase fatty acid binding subunit